MNAWALDIARKLGKRIYGPSLYDCMVRQETVIARGINMPRGKSGTGAVAGRMILPTASRAGPAEMGDWSWWRLVMAKK